MFKKSEIYFILNLYYYLYLYYKIYIIRKYNEYLFIFLKFLFLTN